MAGIFQLSREARDGNAVMNKSVPVIQATNLSRFFGPHKAVTKINLEFLPGSAFGLMGENGAGKTTLLRLIAGLIQPSSGKLEVLGLDPTKQQPDLGHKIGFVPEEPALFPEMGVRSQLLFFGGAKGLSGQNLRDSVDHQLERFDLLSYTKRPCGSLSRGLRKRVALALGFLDDPELMLLDEPTSGLDPVHRDSFISWLLQKRGETSWILSSHDLEEIQSLTSHTAYLEEGSLKGIDISTDLAHLKPKQNQLWKHP